MAIGLGSSSTLGIGLAISLDDKFTEASHTVTKALKQIGLETDNAIEAFEKLDSFGSGLANIGMGISKGLLNTVKTFATFEDIMNSVRVIAGDTGLSDVDYGRMITQVKNLGEMYGILPKDIAAAQLELAKAGIKPNEIMKMTEATMALGAATDTMVNGTGGAAEILINIMQAFNATADEANKYAAIITSAANQSTIDVGDFFQSMRYSADIARSLSVPIEESAAAIATLGNAGLKGSMAGTSLANMYRYLAKALGQFGLKRQQEALALLGVSKDQLVNQDGSIRNMGEILNLIRAQYSTMSDLDKLAATQGIFGVRGDRAAQLLIQALRTDSLDPEGNIMHAYEDMLNKVIKDRDANIHLSQAQDRLNDLLGDWGKLSAAWDRLKITIGQALAPSLRRLVQAVTEGVKSLTDFFQGPAGQNIVRFAGLAGVWMVVLGKFISIGSRFYLYILRSSMSLSSAFELGKASAGVMNRSMIQGSTVFLQNIQKAALTWQKAMMASQGVRAYTSVAGVPMVQGRGARGRYTKGMKSNWLVRLFAMFGGIKGARIATGVTRFFSQIIGMGGTLKLVGGLLGRVFGALFSWPVVLGDIALQLITGKSLFMELWDIISRFISWIGKLIPIHNTGQAASEQRIVGTPGTFGTRLTTGEIIDTKGRVRLATWSDTVMEIMWGWTGIAGGLSEAQRHSKATELLRQRRLQEQQKETSTLRSIVPGSTQDSKIRDYMNQLRTGGKQNIEIVINNPGDKQIRHKLTLDEERALQSYAIG